MNQDVNLFLEILLYPMLHIKLLVEGNKEVLPGDKENDFEKLERANFNTNRNTMFFTRDIKYKLVCNSIVVKVLQLNT